MADQRPSNQWREFEDLVKKVEALERAMAGSIPILESADAPVNTLYVDDLDGKLYFKDAVGVSNALY